MNNVTETETVPTSEAAKALGVSPQMVHEYDRMGWLVGTTRSGKTGGGRRKYFDREEVAAFARGGAPAAKAYRERKAKRGAKS